MQLSKSEIQRIIDYEILVDCYDDQEVNMGWAIFLDDNLNYPFEAEYLIRETSGKQYWQKIKVVNNHSSESNYNGGEYYVEIEVKSLIVLVDLLDLKNFKADKKTMRGIQIWKSKDQ